MNLTVAIASAELRFGRILEEFFISVYDEESLPSHGIDHHRRVWSYSKELLLLSNNSFSTDIFQLTSNLIISSYLHDIGMSIDTGVRHGIHGVELCMQFLKVNNLSEIEFHDALNAIEYHDRKDYKGETVVNDLLKILSVADDLDAFGFTGIYRYSEIYLIRGICYSDIGKMISANAKKRFGNFVSSYEFDDTILKKHRIRFNILENFFDEYDKQVSVYEFGSGKPTGYCGVVEFLREIVLNKMALEDVLREPEKYSRDLVIQWFFNGLNSELTLI